MKNEALFHSESIFKGIEQIIENTRKHVVVDVNTETSFLYWQIGDFINKELLKESRGTYGAKILATVSQELIKLLDQKKLNDGALLHRQLQNRK